ncbi:MAG: Bug family tripartite tricarboxylate transporter substrate binding protein [Burkholderiales bacterium]
MMTLAKGKCMQGVMLAIAALLPMAAGAQATSAGSGQAWPAKPVRLVAPFGTGSVLDTMMRAMQNELSAALGQPIIIESRPGAGGTIGTLAVARGPADGYTFLIAANSHNINGSVYSNLAYHPLKDFTAVASVGSTGYIMMVPASLGVKNVGEFIQLAKAKPGLTYPSAGKGSATHLSMALLVNLAGIDMLHVPFKSTGDAVLEVMSGRGGAMIGANIAVMPYANDSRVRLLGITTATRSKFLPDLPTLSESGLRGYEFDSWLGLVAPVSTPREIVERMNAEIGKQLRNPEVAERLAKQGIEVRALTPEQMNKLLAVDFERMAKVVQIAGAREN